jgi:peptide/nickel transport system permease protein
MAKAKKQVSQQDSQDAVEVVSPGLRSSLKREFAADQLAQFAVLLLALMTIGFVVGSFFIKPEQYVDVNIMDQYMPLFSEGHILGTDQGGRDVLAMLTVASRNSLAIAFLVTFFSLALGTIGGLVTGYFGGKFDGIFMRFIDFMTILPTLMIIIVLVTIVPNYNVFSLVVIMTLLSWYNTVRIIRARTLVEVRRDYVSASKTSGTSNLKIIFFEIFPNLSSLIIVESTLMFAGNIGLETGLSFLGFGLPPTTPSLGTLINYATDPETMTDKPWVWVPAAVVILLYTLLIMLIGQTMRRVADQRQSLG